MKILYICLSILMLTGCSMFGKSNVETAPYSVIKTAEKNTIEVRHYDRLILVSTPMGDSIDDKKSASFSNLFKYISGENMQRKNISMTAPVLMGGNTSDQGVDIPMTAPVFMGPSDTSENVMSFVLPSSYTLYNAPVPKNPDVKLHELKDYTVAAIVFNGLLDQQNINQHKLILENWIEDQGYIKIGTYKAAGYNPPFTIPSLRRNEVLIPIKKP